MPSLGLIAAEMICWWVGGKAEFVHDVFAIEFCARIYEITAYIGASAVCPVYLQGLIDIERLTINKYSCGYL